MLLNHIQPPPTVFPIVRGGLAVPLEVNRLHQGAVIDPRAFTAEEGIDQFNRFSSSCKFLGPILSTTLPLPFARIYYTLITACLIRHGITWAHWSQKLNLQWSIRKPSYCPWLTVMVCFLFSLCHWSSDTVHYMSNSISIKGTVEKKHRCVDGGCELLL